MKHFLIVLIPLLLFACKKTITKIDATNVIQVKENSLPKEIFIKETILDSTKLNINFKAKGSYKQLLVDINTYRLTLQSEYTKKPQETLASLPDYLLETLLNHIIPHWYSTQWAYEGHTNIPNEGEIACGYFVSTTLKHFDFNLNRYKMAQQAGLNAAISLQPQNELKIYRNINYSKLKENLLAVYKDGLYFVGLSNHVGYILIKNKELYFLHSSYCDNKVVIEYAEYSYCFESDIYVFAEVSTNKTLLKKWLFGERIVIVQ